MSLFPSLHKHLTSPFLQPPPSGLTTLLFSSQRKQVLSKRNVPSFHHPICTPPCISSKSCNSFCLARLVSVALSPARDKDWGLSSAPRDLSMGLGSRGGSQERRLIGSCIAFYALPQKSHHLSRELQRPAQGQREDLVE